MQRYSDVVLDRRGNVVGNATVTVKTPDGLIAQIFSANSAALLSNPFRADNLGQFYFYAPNGRYIIEISLGGAVVAVRNDVLLDDPADPGAANIVGGTISGAALTGITINGKAPATQDDVQQVLDDLADQSDPDKGAGGIGYLSTLMGAVGRALSEKIGEIISVKDFGAIGDGAYHPVSEWFTPGFSAYRGYANLAAVQVDYPHVTSELDSIDWAAIQATDNAVAPSGGSTWWVPGKYVINKTLLLKANITGLGKAGAWATDNRGAILTNYGAGNPARWTDIDGSDPANFTPMIVVARSGVTISGITVRDSGARWSCGIFAPCVRRVSLYNTDVMGQFKESGVYLDATWSNVNTTLAALHPTVESDTGMNEFTIIGGFVTGLWGLKVKGTTRPASTTPWVWGAGGTSDIDVINCRLGTDGPASERQVDGGAFYHDAVIPNSAGAGQGINFVNTAFRVAAKYGVKLDHSNRITFINCYGETISSWTSAGNPAAVFAYTSNTGIVSMSNDAVGFAQVKDGVPLIAGSIVEWQAGRTVSKFRTDGHFATPNIYANASSTVGLLLTSFANLGLISLRYDNGTSATPYLHLSNATIRPEVAAGISLGTTGFPFLTGNIQDVRVTTALRPTVDNVVDVGTASFRFAVVRAGTGAINTSDERCKRQIQVVEEAALNAWARVNYAQYKFDDAVDKKGDDARWHFGVIAQRVKEAFEAENLDPFAYGLLCHDVWEAEYEPVMATRTVQVPVEIEREGFPQPELMTIEEEYDTGEKVLVRPAGDRYGIRYDEALALEAALMRRKTEQLEARLAALEKK